MTDALRLLGVLALIGANAFFVVGEYAVVTARRGAIATRGHRRSAVALRLMDDPVRVISTVQVGITAVGILTGALGEPAIRDVLGDSVPSWVAFVIAFGAITYLSVVLGELVPKAITLDRAETILLLVARPIDLLGRLLRPAVIVLERSAAVLLRPLGVHEVTAGEGVRSPEELRELVDEAEESGVIGRAQEELLHRVFDFPAQEAADVMVPARDVGWLDGSLDADTALGRALEGAHSRYPVGDGTLDHVLGVVHVRALAEAAREGRAGPIAPLVRPAHVVPPTKDLGPLLRELRTERHELAIVADEYGRTLGVVTIEDVVEEIVGEIEDEYDLPDGRIERDDDGTLLVAGSLSLDDLEEETGVDLPRDRVRTVGGLVFDALGRRPAAGDAVEVAGTRLQVEAVDGQRIARVRIVEADAEVS